MNQLCRAAVVVVALVCSSIAACSNVSQSGSSSSLLNAKPIAPVRALLNPWVPKMVEPPIVIGGHMGYRHEISKSKFAGGTLLQTKPFLQQEGISYIGTDGDFGAWNNGFVLAVPHAKSASAMAGPLSNNPDTHSTRVRSYFVANGLPEDQIGGADINTEMEEGADPAGHVVHHRFLGYVTILSRKVDGVRVGESFAVAKFNENDEAVYESVWWPPLNSVTTAADTFRAKLQDPAKNAAFRSVLPPELSGEVGELVLHHARPADRVWYNVITLDIAKPGTPYIWHFDVNGQMVKFEPDGAPPSDAK